MGTGTNRMLRLCKDADALNRFFEQKQEACGGGSRERRKELKK